MTSTDTTAAVEVASDTVTFLHEAAAVAGVTADVILRRSLGAAPLRACPGYAEYVGGMDTATEAVLAELDRLLRVANPGSQFVLRKQYVGYRRFDERKPPDTKASRSQIYVSLVPRKAFIRVVLPLEVTEHRDVPRVTDLSGKGHHGVGDLALDIHTVADARALMTHFSDWLGPAAPPD